jgi:hypothetical protein
MRTSQVQDSVSEWDDMSTRELLFQWATTIKIQLGVLVYYNVDLIIISLKIKLFSLWGNIVYYTQILNCSKLSKRLEYVTISDNL